ncbi:MAG: hypothetical protein ACKVGW_20855 [Verrucomicrobiia bacterium]
MAREISRPSRLKDSISLAFTFFHGSPLVQMEAQVSTERDATAFLYQVGLAKSKTEGHQLRWIEPLGKAQSSFLKDE